MCFIAHLAFAFLFQYFPETSESALKEIKLKPSESFIDLGQWKKLCLKLASVNIKIIQLKQTCFCLT